MGKVLAAFIGATVLFAGLWLHELSGRKAAEALADAAAVRVAVEQKETDSVRAVLVKERDSLGKEQAKARTVEQRSAQAAQVAQQSADSAVAVLRADLDSTNQVRLDSVAAIYSRRIAADSARIAALNRLVVQKDEEILTWKREVDQLTRFNDELKEELRIVKRPPSLGSRVADLAIGAAVATVIINVTD